MKHKKLLKMTIGLFFLLIISFISTNVYAEELQQSVTSAVYDSNQIKINNTLLSFNKVIYVSIGGNDTLGDGSIDKPYASVHTAINRTNSGDAVYIKAGKYRLAPMIIDTYSAPGIWDQGKKITIVGENEKTILEYYGADSPSRDGYAVDFTNQESKLMNLVYNYYPGKSANYSNSILGGYHTFNGTIYNVFFDIKGSIKASYLRNTVATTKVANCVFYHSLEAVMPNYGGSVTYENCVTNVPFGPGIQTTCKIKAYDANTLNQSKNDIELVDMGTGTDPDGSIADIGVYGGEFAWGAQEPTLKVDAVDEVNTNDEFTADIVLSNANTICAEDIRIAYDTNLFEHISSEASLGLKIYNEQKLQDGSIRFIIASLGKQNSISGQKALVTLTFRAKKPGHGKIDITRGRIADNGNLEMDILPDNCGEKTIVVKGYLDINRSGTFTLLDLGIDAWYYGDSASATDSSKYDTDVIQDGTINDMDLYTIVQEMLANTNYAAN